MGRVLAFDFGTKRTGIAVTDEEQKIAFPLDTTPTHSLFEYIQKYLSDHEVDRFVVGEPKDMMNNSTDATKYVEQFLKKLNKTYPDLPIDRVDERFTSSLAFQSLIDSGVKRKERRNKELIDKASATIILQSWIDAQRR
jgi:putative Holliday junction resolvase